MYDRPVHVRWNIVMSSASATIQINQILLRWRNNSDTFSYTIWRWPLPVIHGIAEWEVLCSCDYCRECRATRTNLGSMALAYPSSTANARPFCQDLEHVQFITAAYVDEEYAVFGSIEGIPYSRWWGSAPTHRHWQNGRKLSCFLGSWLFASWLQCDRNERSFSSDIG